MLKRNRIDVATVLILAALLGSLAITGSREMSHAEEGVLVDATTGAGVLTLDNGLVSVRFDKAENRFSARSGDCTFIRDGRLRYEEGKASVVTVTDSLGGGKGIEIRYPDGNADLVALYPGVPFVCARTRIHNGGSDRMVVDRITPVSLGVDLGRPSNELRALGCDGLTSADKDRTGYTFLAVADPVTRAGIVAGWLTHNRGSGIVLSRADRSSVRIEGRSEYGKLLIEPGKTAEGETFAVGCFEDNLTGLEAYADAVAKANEIELRPVTCGYCTWYHAGALNAKAMAKLADFCEENLTKFGFEVLQIDDKWQISNRDFTSHRPDGPYPGGMKPTADKIRAAGMTAGIWFIPFGWDHERPVFEDHQDWFVHRETGEVYDVYWAGDCLDMTHPEAREFLRGVVSRITGEWGYKYIKIDGLWTGLAAKILYPEPTYGDDNLGDAVFHDPCKTNIEAYRDGLKLVRKAAGDDVFILGCNIAQNMRTLGASFGLVDGMRVGRDIGAALEQIKPCAEMGSRLYFFHNRVWYNDPDCLMLRPPLTLDQARAWGSWIAVSGQLNLVSEWLPRLPSERLDVVRRSMPNHGLCGRPVDLFDRNLPQVWHLAAGADETRRDIVGLFNWDEQKSSTLSVDLDRLDLPDSEAGSYVGFDYWANEFVAPFGGTLEAELPPGSCRVIAIQPVLDRPRLVSTSRHITQGVVDVLAEDWSASTLSGTSLVVADDPYELRIVTPTGGKKWNVRSARVSREDKRAGVTIKVKPAGRNVRATVSSPISRKVSWEILFE